MGRIKIVLFPLFIHKSHLLRVNTSSYDFDFGHIIFICFGLFIIPALHYTIALCIIFLFPYRR